MTEQEMLKEALEWQEHIRKLITATDDELYHKRSKVFDWLLEQAERAEKNAQDLEDMDKQLASEQKRVEKLEKDLNALHYVYNLQAERVEELEEFKRNAERMYKYYHISAKKSVEEKERYKQALEFYADEEHYKEKLISEAQYDADGICISNDEYAPPIIYLDGGEKARQALEGEE